MVTAPGASMSLDDAGIGRAMSRRRSTRLAVAGFAVCMLLGSAVRRPRRRRQQRRRTPSSAPPGSSGLATAPRPRDFEEAYRLEATHDPLWNGPFVAARRRAYAANLRPVPPPRAGGLKDRDTATSALTELSAKLGKITATERSDRAQGRRSAERSRRPLRHARRARRERLHEGSPCGVGHAERRPDAERHARTAASAPDRRRATATAAGASAGVSPTVDRRRGRRRAHRSARPASPSGPGSTSRTKRNEFPRPLHDGTATQDELDDGKATQPARTCSSA